MKRFLLYAVLFLSFPGPSVFAEAISQAQSVTVHVPSFLNLGGSSSSVDLAFQDNQAGSETNALTVTYTVNSNSMSQGDGAPTVSAYLNDSFEGIDFKASFGNFSKGGGNTELAPAVPGFVVIGSAPTVLATKANSTGDGKVLRGQFPITYQASARSQLASGDYTRQLTLTLTDI